jgi:hypothetical protein
MSAERILAAIARKGGGRLLNVAIAKTLPEPAPAGRKSKALLGGIAGAIATRIALRSVPGAILVGGAALAKTLHDRRKARRASGKDAAET